MAKVDYDNKDELVAALQGHDALLCTLAVDAAPDTQDKLYAAAAEAGVKWILPNEFGYTDLGDEINQQTIIGAAKKKVRENIEALGLSWIGLATGFWFEFSMCGGLDRFGFDVPARKVRWFGDGNAKLSASTFPMVGRATAALLALPLLPEDENDSRPTIESFRNKHFTFASFTMNQKEMWAELQKVTGTTEKDWTVEKEENVPAYWGKSMKALQTGDREAFGRVLYSRFFYPDEPGNMEKAKELQNDTLGLRGDDIGEYLNKAIKMAEDDYMAKQYGGSN